jgi:hypothetical protein
MRLRVGYASGQAECSQARGPGLVWFQGLALGAKHHSTGTGLIQGLARCRAGRRLLPPSPEPLSHGIWRPGRQHCNKVQCEANCG